jgi:dynein heavy chain, axonemal
MVFLFDDQHIL